jgi:hypothetical protein
MGDADEDADASVDRPAVPSVGLVPVEAEATAEKVVVVSMYSMVWQENASTT